MLLAQNSLMIVTIIMAVFALAFFVVIAVLLLTVFTPWMRAFTSGTPVSMLDIIGMRFRKVNVGVVLQSLIAANQGGAPVSCHDMERAYLQGCDLEKLTLAMISAKQQDMQVTFEELMRAELDGRLEEKLGRR